VIEVTVQVRVPVVVPLTDMPCAAALPPVSTAEIDAPGIPSSYPLRVGVSVGREFESPVVKTGPEPPKGVTPDVAPRGVPAETPSAEESLKMMVCTVDVGFPSGPRTTAVVNVVKAPVGLGDEPV
jgi:hypothetical protein